MKFSLLPKVIFEKLTDISPEYLRKKGIRLLMLDFDNTMLPYITNAPTPELLQWLESFRDSGVSLCIVSNSNKPRVQEFGKKHAVTVITGAKKPFQRGIRQCLVQYGAAPEDAALCGDQTFTDVLGANCGKLYSIQVKSINNHNFWLKLRHLAEVPFIFMARKRRYTNEES
jgi:HAD superfamily phosphatase (TIGR01668 family)